MASEQRPAEGNMVIAESPHTSEIERLPPELKDMVIEHLEYFIDDLCFRVAMRYCYAQTPRPKKPNSRDWNIIHRVYEMRTGPKKLLSLACEDCHQLLSPDAFTDSQRSRRYTGGEYTRGRFCIPCGLKRTAYDTRAFFHQGERKFACYGCQMAKPLDEEANAEEVVELKSRRGFSHREIQRMKTKLWCEACRIAVKAEIDEYGALTPQAPSGHGSPDWGNDYLWFSDLESDAPLEYEYSSDFDEE